MLDEAVTKAARGGPPVTLVLCDLDGLKAINDVHGHPTGDAALRALVDLLSSNLRAYDSVGRVGGDEFALLLQGAEAEATAAIVGRLATTIEGGAAGVADVRASFGTARCPDDGTTRDALMALADARLYEDKDRTRAERRSSDVVDVGGFVVGDGAGARGAPPAGLHRGAAGGVVERGGAGGALRPPLGEQAERAGQLGALRGERVRDPVRAVASTAR